MMHLQTKIKEMKNQMGGGLGFFMTIFLIISILVAGASLIQKANIPKEFHPLLIQPVSAAEVGDEFLCPCCGEKVSECDCGMAVERQDFIKEHMGNGENLLELYTAYSQEFSIEEFENKSLEELVAKYIEYTAPDSRPVLEFTSEVEIDAGELVQADYAKGEEYELRYDFQNTGEEELVINGIDSSCMCTLGQVVVGDQKSPKLGMNHNGDPVPEWEVRIAPGEMAQLNVYYDPNYHGEYSGDVTRTVTLESNDPVNKQQTVRFNLNQI